MAEKKILVPDASVIIKWFNSEPLREKALAIRKSFLTGRISLVIPSLLLYELANGLRYNPKFGIEETRSAVNTILEMKIPYEPFEGELVKEAVGTAYRFGITLYDASYVALAFLQGGVHYTADEKVVGKLSSDQVRHLSEFES